MENPATSYPLLPLDRQQYPLKTLEYRAPQRSPRPFNAPVIQAQRLSRLNDDPRRACALLLVLLVSIEAYLDILGDLERQHSSAVFENHSFLPCLLRLERSLNLFQLSKLAHSLEEKKNIYIHIKVGKLLTECYWWLMITNECILGICWLLMTIQND